MKTTVLNFSEVSLVLSGRDILPAVLKMRSTGAEDAGTDSAVFAIRANFGNSDALDFHQIKSKDHCRNPAAWPYKNP